MFAREAQMSAVCGWLWSRDEVEDFAGDGACEAAEDVLLRLAFGGPACCVGAGLGACGQTHDCDLVERGVRGTVVAKVDREGQGLNFL